MTTSTYDEFTKIDIRVGTVLAAAPLEGARKAAYKLSIDFGEFGIMQSSAQITKNYTCEELIGRQVVAVVNFEPRRIAGFKSEVLTCGFDDEKGHVVLAQPARPVPNGSRLY